jgi:hypothetical protein
MLRMRCCTKRNGMGSREVGEKAWKTNGRWSRVWEQVTVIGQTGSTDAGRARQQLIRRAR